MVQKYDPKGITTIRIIVRGGVVQSVEACNMPTPGIHFIQVDYDTDGDDPMNTFVDEEGDLYSLEYPVVEEMDYSKTAGFKIVRYEEPESQTSEADNDVPGDVR